MRKLLFRVWDPNTDRMLETNVGIDKIGLYDFDGDRITEQEGLVIMQFTGLLDRNGKEVYEGDIVKYSRGCPHVVEWVQDRGGTFFGGMPMFYLSGLMNGYSWTGEEEIIGNIYENPDLLGGTANVR